jgi:serine/threonine-protein kinase
MAPQKAGRYELIEEVGRGAMGVVYRARDPLIGRHVAVKTLKLDDVRQGKDDPEVLERFQNEIRAAGRLAHPNIVVIHDAGADTEAGLFYITMEFVPGRSLAKMLEEKQAFPVPRVMRIMEQACRALDYAHHNHIVHRDIKPANILMGELDTVKLTDFGTAKILERGGTQSGQIVGTPSYMAPEQVKGRPVDGRADVFALSVILYELLTGERPFPGKNVTTVIYKIVHEEPLAPIQLDSSIHPGLNAVILRGLSKEPDDRYASCGDFLNALRTYRETQSSGAQTVVRRVSPLPLTRPVIAGQTVAHPAGPGAPQPDSPAQFSTGNPSITTSQSGRARTALPAPAAAAPPAGAPPPVVPGAHPAPAAAAAPSVPPPMPRLVQAGSVQKSSSGAWLIFILLLAAAGTGGYFYQDRILELWHQLVPQSGSVATGEKAAAPQGAASATSQPQEAASAPSAPAAAPQPGATGAAAGNASAAPSAPATVAAATFPEQLLPAKEKLESQLQKLGFADRVHIAPAENALALRGELTAAEHRRLFLRLPVLPGKIRVLDETTVAKPAEAAAAGASAPSPGNSTAASTEKQWSTPGKGALDVGTDAPSASVTLLDAAGKPVGDCRTPCRFPDLAPGKYTASVKVSGFPPVARSVDVKEGWIEAVRVHSPAAGKKAAMGTLEVLSVPVGADILVNGESTGRRTPSKIQLPAGNYQVMLYLKGYAPFQRTVDVEPSRAIHLEAMLVHQP